jgi:hypothetical protein
VEVHVRTVRSAGVGDAAQYGAGNTHRCAHAVRDTHHDHADDLVDHDAFDHDPGTFEHGTFDHDPGTFEHDAFDHDAFDHDAFDHDDGSDHDDPGTFDYGSRRLNRPHGA